MIVSFPDPALKEGKGLVYIEQFPGPPNAAGHVIGMTTHHFGMVMHQLLSRACSIRPTKAIARCHMIITSIPHGLNLIGGGEFRNETSSSPRKRSMQTRPFPSLRAGSGNETS